LPGKKGHARYPARRGGRRGHFLGEKNDEAEEGGRYRGKGGGPTLVTLSKRTAPEKCLYRKFSFLNKEEENWEGKTVTFAGKGKSTFVKKSRVLVGKGGKLVKKKRRGFGSAKRFIRFKQKRGKICADGRKRGTQTTNQTHSRTRKKGKRDLLFSKRKERLRK